MRYYLVFGLICAALIAFLYLSIYDNTAWDPYAVWIAAVSATTLGIYGFDKLLSKISNHRTPEIILHLLALLGGFLGGWAGMALFHHKTNRREHPAVWLVLALGTLGHIVLFWY